MSIRLVNADDVKDIICKYEKRTIQRMMILEVEKMHGCIATRKQEAEILGYEDIGFWKEKLNR